MFIGQGRAPLLDGPKALSLKFNTIAPICWSFKKPPRLLRSSSWSRWSAASYPSLFQGTELASLDVGVCEPHVLEFAHLRARLAGSGSALLVVGSGGIATSSLRMALIVFSTGSSDKSPKLAAHCSFLGCYDKAGRDSASCYDRIWAAQSHRRSSCVFRASRLYCCEGTQEITCYQADGSFSCLSTLNRIKRTIRQKKDYIYVNRKGNGLLR